MKILSNQDCYDRFSNLFETVEFYKTAKTTITEQIYKGIDDGLLCSLSTCNLTAINEQDRSNLFKCVSLLHFFSIFFLISEESISVNSHGKKDTYPYNLSAMEMASF